MTCLNGHDDDQIKETDGKRVCTACRSQYLAESNKRKVQAIKENRQARHNSQNGRLRKQTKKHIQNRHNAETRVARKALGDPVQRVTSKEKNNERNDHR